MVTLNSANAALKTMYLDVVANQLNNEVHPFLACVEKTSQDVVGKLVKKLVPYGINGGIGAGTEAGSLPKAQGNNYLLFETTLKNLYGTIELSDKALRASSGEAGAFVNLLTAEMEGLLSASKFNFARMLYGNGTGLLGSGVATSSGGYTFVMDSLKNIMFGQKVDIYVNDVFSHSARITNWDYEAKTITFDVACTQDMADNTKTTSLYIQGSKNKEITGLGAIFDNNITSIYGALKSSYTFLTPISKTTQSLTESDIMAVLDDCEEKAGSQPNFITCSYDARLSFQNLFKNNKLNLDTQTLNGGYVAMTFNGIPLIAERFADNGTFYFLNSEDFKLEQLGDWQWLENDKGQILKQKEGYPTHTATLVKYAELVCQKPGAQAKLVIS
ncbi:MAG: phage major capsid protein [Clostridia bacterium]|nr:phage major capsid protein [Clostridia bacterium]